MLLRGSTPYADPAYISEPIGFLGLTARYRLPDNPSVRKASVIPAAFLAAVFVFSTSPDVEAAGASSRTGSATARKPSSAPRAAVKKAPPTRENGTSVSKKSTSVKRSTVRKKGAVRKRPVTAASRRSTRPSSREESLVSRVAVETPQWYGPFQPVETYDYPRPGCEPLDAVLEAHVHEADAETPELDDVAEAVPSGVNALARVARTLGSLLRPKSSLTTLRPEDVDLSDLLSAGVQIPVEGVDPSRLRDSFLASRGRHAQHLAIDIGAPRGTPVLAAADGQIMQMRREKRGGISLYQKDPTGRYLLFYCHLSRYAKGLGAGDNVQKGEIVGYVGSTGRVIGGPHLHFSITRLPDGDDNFKAGVAINPYLLFLAAVP